MTDRSTGPRCGNNPNTRLTPGDLKAVDDAKARLALLADARPYIDRAVWVDGDPLMEVIASTVWKHCGRDSEDMPQLVCDDPRTIAALAAAVARAHAAAVPAPATDQAALGFVSNPQTGYGQATGGNTPPAQSTDQAALRDRIAEAVPPLTEADRDPVGDGRREWSAYVRAWNQGRDEALAVLSNTSVLAPDGRRPVLREAADDLLASDLGPRPGHTEDYGNGWSDATLRAQSYLRMKADRAAAALPAPADRAAVLREAADFVGNDDECDCGGCDTCIPRKLADELRRMADDARDSKQQGDDPRATLARVREVLETEAVVGRTALEYRGLITAALMGPTAEAQQDGAQS
jgi:hypothetical protein